MCGLTLEFPKQTYKKNQQFDADLMRRVRVIDATSAGTAVLELDMGNEYSNRGGKTLDSATVMKDCGLI